MGGVRARGAAAALAIGAAGCIGVPSPLAPGFGGSVGLPHDGVLSHSMALPQRGDGFKRLRNDGIRWANARLVRALERAAATVAAERPGPPLVVGDLSAEHGGRIARHRSHRNGRDADLLFFLTTPAGLPIENTGFPRFGADGLAKTERGEQKFVRLDVERNWLVIKALMTDPEAQVQWLFVARWVEALIIDHARARGEDDELLFRASKVLQQPSDSFSHDDHIHVRIACGALEEAAGCVENGPRWPWLEGPPTPEVSDAELLAALFSEPAGEAKSDAQAVAAPDGAL